MTTIQQIRSALRRLSDPEIRELALAIVDNVAVKLARGSDGLWTIGVIAQWLSVDASEPALARSVQLLATKQDARLFDVHYLYFDRAGVFPDGAKIPDEKVAEAYKSGYFEDPSSGEEITNFENFLEPYFVPSAELTGAEHASQ